MKKDFVNKKSFKIVETIIGLGLAVLTGYLSYKFDDKNFLSDAFVGFMVPYVTLLPFQIKGKGKAAEKTQKLDEALKKLEEHDKNTYDLYCTEVKVLTDSINKSCDSLLYPCSYTPNMMLYKDVCTRLMSYFSGKSEQDYFYATAECSRNSINWFFDKSNLSGEFLPLLNDKCKLKKITNFKRLFIYDDKDLTNPVFVFLAILHDNIKRNHKSNYCDFDFKFINKKAFDNIVTDNYISNEMGVWGTHCVFIQTNKTSPSGYSFDKELISQHKDVFDELWDNKNSINYHGLNIDYNKLQAIDRFEESVLEVLKNIRDNNDNCTIKDGIKDRELSLLNITDIQKWVLGSFRLSNTLIANSSNK